MPEVVLVTTSAVTSALRPFPQAAELPGGVRAHPSAGGGGGGGHLGAAPGAVEFLFRGAARQFDAAGEAGADGHAQYGGPAHRPRDGEKFVGHGAALHGVVNGQHRGGVVHHAPHRAGQRAGRHHTACDLIHQRLLVSGGIKTLHGVQAHGGACFTDGRLQRRDLLAVGLLQGDDAVREGPFTADGVDGLDELGREAGHDGAVGAQQRLTLGAVYKEVCPVRL